MSSTRLYHISRDGKLLGKYDEGVMRELLRVGKLRPTDDYWTPGMKAWAKLAILPPRRVSSTTQATVNTRAQSNATPTKRKINWTKLWPVPALLVLALLIGYAASSSRTQALAPARERKATVRKTKDAPEPSRVPIEFTQGFAPFRPLGKELFPSHLIASANSRLKPRNPASPDGPHYGSPDFMAGVQMAVPKEGDRMVVEVSADRLMRPSSVSFTVTKGSAFATAGPAPSFDYEALGKVRQTTPFNVTIKVRRNDDDPIVFTEVWQAHQINDCPIHISVTTMSKSGDTFSERHLSPTLAGYVNENHPLVDQILTEAKDTGICRAFVGYGDKDDDVMRQIRAVWKALQNRGITYSNIAESTHSTMHSFQHVRMFEQSLNSGQANCVDATVMLASVLKKIGLKVGVILVPKHAYLVVYDKTGKRREFAIESTGLANATLEDSIRAATEEHEYNLRKIEEQLDDDSKDGDFFELAIEDSRKAGVQPIPYAP
jgi:hypothetical protein